MVSGVKKRQFSHPIYDKKNSSKKNKKQNHQFSKKMKFSNLQKLKIKFPPITQKTTQKCRKKEHPQPPHFINLNFNIEIYITILHLSDFYAVNFHFYCFNL